MKRLLGLFLLGSLFLFSCSESPVCPDAVCTKEFRTVTIRFVNADGNPQQVKDYTVLNKRTGEIMTPLSDMVAQGLYVVASDSDLSKLSEKGDNIQVNARDIKTNTKLQADFVISGGICSCHISKISGPDTVKI